jgi:hypothetical protein
MPDKSTTKVQKDASTKESTRGSGGDLDKEANRDIHDYPLWCLDVAPSAKAVLVGGGGGRSKTGIGNGLVLYQYKDDNTLHKVAVYNANDRAINNVALHPEV